MPNVKGLKNVEMSKYVAASEFLRQVDLCDFRKTGNQKPYLQIKINDDKLIAGKRKAIF